MAIEVSFTPDFERQLKRLANKYNSIYKDLDSLIDDLEINPNSGTHLGKNLYKVRMAISSKSKGKSGGARVITYLETELIANFNGHLQVLTALKFL